MTDTHTPPNFDQRVLVGVKGQLNPENYRLFQAWRRAEGGTAKWNPLNSTLTLGSQWTETTPYNSVGVRNYRYETVGVAATILTLIQRNADGTMRYGGILADLQSGTRTAEEIVRDRLNQFDTWGTDTDLLLRVLAEIPSASAPD